MTDHANNADDSQARRRDYFNTSGLSMPDRESFIRLAERVTELEVRQRMSEKQLSRDIESMERRMKEDLEEVKQSVRHGLSDLGVVIKALDKNVQLNNIALAEIKVKSSIIGAISAGITFFLMMGLEWLKTKTRQP